MVDRSLATLLLPRFSAGQTSAVKLPLGEHELEVVRFATGVRAHVSMPIPRALRAAWDIDAKLEATDAGRALLNLADVRERLQQITAPFAAGAVNAEGIAVWRVFPFVEASAYDGASAPPALDPFSVADLVEHLACLVDPWLAADPAQPWRSVIGPGVADLVDAWDEHAGQARGRLRARDLEGELRIRPVSRDRFDLELELELDPDATEEPLRLTAAAFPFRVADKVQCGHPLVDDAFFVRGPTGARIFSALTRPLLGWLEFGGHAFDLEIDRSGLRAHARVDRALVPRWVWSLADVCRLAADAFHRAPDTDPPYRRWFAPLASEGPTDVGIDLGTHAASSWRRAATALGREVGAVPGPSRVFRGEYDLVGQIGDQDIALSLRGHGEALLLATCTDPPRMTYSNREVERVGDAGAAGALLDRWRDLDARYFLSVNATHSDLKRSRPGVSVLRLFVQRLPPRELVAAWRSVESLLRHFDPGCTRGPAEHFLDAVKQSEISLTPEGVAIQGTRGRLFWGEPWHALHAPRLRLRVDAYCRADRAVDYPLGPADFIARLDPAVQRFRAIGTEETLRVDPEEDHFTISVRAHRARIHQAVSALALAWKLSLA